MPQRKQPKQKDRRSEGEDFSDVSSTSSLGSVDESVAHNWTFPVVPLHAKREEYETVSNFLHSLSQI